MLDELAYGDLLIEEIGQMQSLVSKNSDASEETIANPLLSGAKVVSYANDYSEVHFLTN